jgi:hypothetical protein
MKIDWQLAEAVVIGALVTWGVVASLSSLVSALLR